MYKWILEKVFFEASDVEFYMDVLEARKSEDYNEWLKLAEFGSHYDVNFYVDISFIWYTGK